MDKYEVEYITGKDGNEWTKEKMVEAYSCVDAIEIVRTMCAENYASCDVISVKDWR